MFNAHYEGTYDERMLAWRRLGATDKASNLAYLLQGTKVGSVLEVGCGTGAVLSAVRLAKIGTQHTGIDLADPGPHRDPNAIDLILQQYDGKVLPYADNSFDLVYASHVLEHVPEPRELLSEIKRVARKWIYLEVPCELHLRTNTQDLQRTLDIGHINAYTPESFRLLIESSSLKVERQGLFDHSLEVQSFNTSRAKGLLKYALRNSLLALSPKFAARVFAYHTGILVEKLPEKAP